MSALVAVAVVALFLMAGLVIDGGAQLVATRRAEALAAGAARAGADAASVERVGGALGSSAAIAASQAWLSRQGVRGTTRLQGTSVVVETEIPAHTTFLSLLGIRELTGRGSSSARLRRG